MSDDMRNNPDRYRANVRMVERADKAERRAQRAEEILREVMDWVGHGAMPPEVQNKAMQFLIALPEGQIDGGGATAATDALRAEARNRRAK